MSLNAILNEMNVPPLFSQDTDSDIKAWEHRRKEMLDLLETYEYGKLNIPEYSVKYNSKTLNENALAGRARLYDIQLEFNFCQEIYSFNVTLLLPKTDKPAVAVFPNFNKPFPDSFFPVEEIIDRGIGVAKFHYQDVALDDPNAFESGFARLFAGKRQNSDCAGTIAVWAWACSQVADYLQTRDDIDFENLMVIGHSRLGKTALLAGAKDNRFKFVFSNNAGCSGDMLARARIEGSEDIRQITDRYPHWFCPKYKEFADNEMSLPFDQHFLIALIAPRYVCCSLAEDDIWAGLNSQYYSLILAKPAWQLYKKNGLMHPDRKIVPQDTFFEGEAGIFMRKYAHYLGRYDWNKYIDFFYKHSGKN